MTIGKFKLMRYTGIIRIVGFILMLFSVINIAPIAISFYYHDGGTRAFIDTLLIQLFVGTTAWFIFRKQKTALKTRDGFLIVAVVWFVLGAFAALPFYLSPLVHTSLINALFEAISGLTTTGASVMTNLDLMPHAVLFYRQELQFFGGMGIVVLAVAVLPMLGIGGMQLYRAETPGPMKNRKLTPRIAETAKALWAIYTILTIACAICYWLAGMNLFNAICESFSTVATGGFSPHDASFAFYHSSMIDLIAIFFMFISGINFGLHFTAFRRKSIKVFWQDVEFRYYLSLVLISTLMVFIGLLAHEYYPSTWQDLIRSLFTIVSLATTTGLTNGNFSIWPSFIPLFLLLISMIGACGGSTTGGMKTSRFIILCKLCALQFKKLIHPNAIYPLKFGQQEISQPLVEAVLAFVIIYVAFWFAATLILLTTGLDLTTALSTAALCVSNLGVGLGSVADGFSHLSDVAKSIMMVLMVAGRLEIFTLILLFTPDFWRK